MEIKLNEALRIKRRADTNGEFVVTITEADVAIIAGHFATKMWYHGLRQKVGDAASSAKDNADAKARMEACIENLKNGVWGKERSGGETEDPFEAAIRTIVRKMLNDASKLAYKNAEDKDAFLMDKYYTASAEVREDIERRANLLLGAKAKAEFTL